MTRTQIRALIRKRLGETTAAFWTDSQLNDWIDFAGHEIAYKTKCIQTSDFITSVADTAAYTPTTEFTDLISILEVYFKTEGTTWHKLTPMTRDDMDKVYPGWKSASSGTPTHYFWDKQDDVLNIYVPPNATNAGTDYVEVYYAQDFTDISDDADAPTGLDQQLQIAMVDWVVATGWETRGNLQKANDSWQKYNGRLRDWMAVTGNEEYEDVEIVTKSYKNL